MHSSPHRARRVEMLLDGAHAGGPETLDRLVPLIYEELRAIAHRQLRGELREHTLHTTALVHEAYLRLAGDGRVTGRGRAYFFAAAAQAMRRVLVDRARRRNSLKRGGGAELVTLGDEDAAVDAYAVELLELDDALHRLGEKSPRQVKVVEYRFFAGMNVEDTAAALDVSPRTVESDWSMARAWLLHALGRDVASGGGDG
ncbi:MAG TPA: ECF-type sigma factor [Longimicrobiales bacterium]|nr:ECF-type sigma factor [Longimicrobiales bacterium]